MKTMELKTALQWFIDEHALAVTAYQDGHIDDEYFYERIADLQKQALIREQKDKVAMFKKGVESSTQESRQFGMDLDDVFMVD